MSANLLGLYFLHFTTFRDQTLQFYSFYDALGGCIVVNFVLPACLDQNLVLLESSIDSRRSQSDLRKTTWFIPEISSEQTVLILGVI